MAASALQIWPNRVPTYYWTFSIARRWTGSSSSAFEMRQLQRPDGALPVAWF